MRRTVCRFCDGALVEVLDLGETPLANHLLAHPEEPPPAYPLRLMRCAACTLLQLDEAVPKEVLFSDKYTYATPVSDVLSDHYVATGDVLSALLPGGGATVEIGSNNGVFLRSLPCRFRPQLGVEASANVAAIACERGTETWTRFFDEDVAAAIVEERGQAALVVARHCFAHLDNTREVLRGMRRLLQPDGILLIENAYAIDTMQGVQFDQIYHEHMSYLGVLSVRRFLEAHDLRLVHVMRSPIHGGTACFFATHASSRRPADPEGTVEAATRRERALLDTGLVDRFALRARRAMADLGAMVRTLVERGHVVDIYGATAKATTLLHGAGLTAKEIRQAHDASPLKHGKWLPEARVPIGPKWSQGYPGYAILTAWNYEAEILRAEQAFREAGGKFIVPVPEPRLV